MRPCSRIFLYSAQRYSSTNTSDSGSLNSRRSESLPSSATPADSLTTIFARRSFPSRRRRGFASRLPYDGGPPSVGDDGDDGASGDDGAAKCEPNGIAASYGVERGPLLKMELDETSRALLSARRCGMEAVQSAPFP